MSKLDAGRLAMHAKRKRINAVALMLTKSRPVALRPPQSRNMDDKAAYSNSNRNCSRSAA